MLFIPFTSRRDSVRSKARTNESTFTLSILVSPLGFLVPYFTRFRFSPIPDTISILFCIDVLWLPCTRSFSLPLEALTVSLVPILAVTPLAVTR